MCVYICIHFSNYHLDRLDSFIIISKCPFSLVTVFVLKSVLSDISAATVVLLIHISTVWYIFFPPFQFIFIFESKVRLSQTAYGWIFLFKQNAIFCLLIYSTQFNPFTFSVITDKVGFTSLTLLFCFTLCLMSFWYLTLPFCCQVFVYCITLTPLPFLFLLFMFFFKLFSQPALQITIYFLIYISLSQNYTNLILTGHKNFASLQLRPHLPTFVLSLS